MTATHVFVVRFFEALERSTPCGVAKEETSLRRKT